VNFSQLITSLVENTTNSISLFRPELVLCATIVAMLFLRVLRFSSKLDSFYIALIGAAVGLWYSAPWKNLDSLAQMPSEDLFTGMLVHDSFTVYFRAILLFFAVLFVIFTRLSGIPDREEAPEFYSLVLGATIGMCLMASANHLMIIFLGVEMASVPSYVLAGILKGRTRASEAALKYAVYGAGAAGIMLYGISLLAGVLGSCHLPTMAERLADGIASGDLAGQYMVLVLGGLMLSVGLAFKLSAFPFHFWCPDVFEGATAEVNAFLSVASKAAALALLVRVAVGFGTVPQESRPYVEPMAGRVAATAKFASVSKGGGIITTVARQEPSAKASDSAAPSGDAASRVTALAPVRRFMALLIAIISAVTCTFGNLAAYGQTNIKRLMAYSTIAHAGYIMMPVAAGVALAGTSPQASQAAFIAVPFYVGLYLFMNLGAFAIIAFVRNTIRSEEIEDYRGLVRYSPGIAVCMTLILFSLVGLPPLAGFAAKYVAFAALVSAMQTPEFRWMMLSLLVVGGLNTAVSLFYYIRVVKAMTIESESTNRPMPEFPMVSLRGAFIALVTVPVFVLGIFWNQFYQWLLDGAGNLL
jgi:NADH-quinone oxidoreductase subunit N